MRSLLRVFLCLGIALPFAQALSASLPDETCVREMRSARLAEERGELDSALAGMERAAEVCPDSLLPLVHRIDLQRSRGLSADEGLATLEQRLREASRPVSPAEVHVLAAASGVDEEILGRVASGLGARGSEDPRLLLGLAELQERLGRLEAAASTLETLLEQQPDEDVISRLVDLYYEMERPADEARWLAVLVEERPGRRPEYAQALSRAGKVEELHRQLDLLAAADSTTVPAEIEEGGADAVPLTLTPGETAGRTFPGHTGFLAGLAWNLYDLGLEAEAEALFRQARETTPYAQRKEQLGEILLQVFGSEEDRRRFAEETAQRWADVDDPMDLFDEGTQRLTAGDAAGALELLRRAAPELPRLEAAWYNLGMAAYTEDEWETAVDAFGRAVELNSARKESYLFRGLALFELERWEEAVEWLEEALELDPSRTNAHYHLSVAYSHLGDTEQAERHRELYDASRTP